MADKVDMKKEVITVEDKVDKKLVINDEALDILAKKIRGFYDSGEWELPHGVTESVEAVAKATAEQLIRENGEHLNNKAVAEAAIAMRETEQKSETPFCDIINYGSALRRGDMKAAQDHVEKDHVIGTTTAGGHLAPTEYSNQLIDLVFKDSNVMGYCKKIPMKSNALVIPTRTAGLTAYTVAESSDAAGGSTATTESTTTFATVTLTAYKHGVVTYISNELLEDADPSIEALVREDITYQLGSYVDWEIFHGTGAAGADGTAGLISGLEGGSVITTNVDSAGGALSFDDMNYLRTPLDNVNAPLTYFMNPATERALMGVKDGNQRYIYDPSVRSGDVPVVWGVPVVTNNRISKTLGGGSETAAFSGAFSQSALIGVKNSVNLIVDPFTYSNYATTRVVGHFRIAFTVASETHFAMVDGITV